MRKSGQHESAQQVFRNARARANFYKKTLAVVSYTTACTIVALAMAYWPVAAGNILTKLNVPAHLTSASDVSNRIHKADRLSGVSFGEQWRAVPMPSAVIGGDRNRREAPQAERHIEKIPFGCDSAFSRLVTKGNFSTRCIADLETSPINT
jgi:hypothetical protein